MESFDNISYLYDGTETLPHFEYLYLGRVFFTSQ
jgi:hypothetical protein